MIAVTDIYVYQRYLGLRYLMANILFHCVLGHLSECRRALTELVEFKREEYRRSFKPTVTYGENKSVTVKPPSNWKPQGKLVAHLHEHAAAVNRYALILLCLLWLSLLFPIDNKFMFISFRLSVHPNGSVFASCSSDGTVKLWDSQRMEGKSIANRSRWTYNKQGIR